MLYAAKNVPRMNRFAHHVVIGSGAGLNNAGVGADTNSNPSAGSSSIGSGTISSAMFNTSTGYLGASLRRSRGRLATNYVRRADSLLGSRSARATIKH